MQSGIPKPHCESKSCHFLLNTGSVSIKLYLSMFFKRRIIFPWFDHTTALLKIWNQLQSISVLEILHSATLEGPSLLSAKAKI